MRKEHPFNYRIIAVGPSGRQVEVWSNDLAIMTVSAMSLAELISYQNIRLWDMRLKKIIRAWKIT